MPRTRPRTRYTSRTTFRSEWQFHIERADLSLDEFPYHEHEFSELVVIAGGESRHVTEDGEHALSAGDVFVFNGRHAHGFKRARRLRLYNVMYDPERLLGPAGELGELPGYHALFVLEPRYRRHHRFRSRLHLSMDDLAHARQLLDAMLDEYDRRRAGHRAAVRGLFLQLAVFLARRYSESSAETSRSLVRIGAVMSYMEAHAHEPLRLDSLAKMAHMSVNNYLRVFKEATGHSPIEYVIRLRVMRAAELLRQTPEKITSLALRAGFSDSNYFAKQFRKVMGLSPREYRRASRA